jgi:pimeloyl-ACP methyl ester carboxylesterase
LKFLLSILLLGMCGCGTRTSTVLLQLELCGAGEGPSGAYCGVHEVFEDRAAGAGRKVALKVVVLPALSNEPLSDPLFFLAGGPGQAATELAGPIQSMFSRVRRQRDIVLVDQRGTGKDHPLRCEEALKDEDKDPNAIDFEMPWEKIRECLASFEGDAARYTTTVAMDDLDEVRAWLGYERINLYGGSYGTRAALVYLRQHPQTVRSVILDGVAPTGMAIPLQMPSDIQRALDKVLEACAAEPGCNERFPDLGEKFRALLAKLEREQPKARLRHPRTGEPVELTISPRVLHTLAGPLYVPWMSSLIPLVIQEASEGNFAPLLALAFSGEGIAETISQGMHFSIVCSEDAPLVEAADPEAAAAGTFLGASLLQTRWKACEFWPRAQVPPEYYEPVTSDAPVLILSGDLDPVTPPRWGELAARTLPNSRHLIAPAAGHGVLTNGCAMRLIEQFLETADASKLDASCLEEGKRPPFFVRPSGPDAGPREGGS